MEVDERIVKTAEFYNEHIDEFADKYLSESFLDDELNRFAELAPGKKVLDVGCGPGNYSYMLSKRGFDVVGIDMSEKMVEIAKKKFSDIPFKHMDMTNLEFPSNTFDAVWSSASFIHVPKEMAFTTLFGFHRVLKPKGILFLNTMKEREGTSKSGFYGGRYFEFYTEEDLNSLAALGGFKIIEMYEKEDDRHVWLNVFAREFSASEKYNRSE